MPEDKGPANTKGLDTRTTRLPVFTKAQNIMVLPSRPSTSISTVSTVQRYRSHKREWKGLLYKANKNGRNILHMVAWGVAPEAAEFLVHEIVRERLSNRLIREKDYKSRTPWDVLNGQLSGGDKDERALRRAKAALEKAGVHLDAAQEKDVQTKILPKVDEQHENTNNTPNTTPRH